MYLVKIYGHDPQAGPDALLEEADFTSGLDAVKYIADQAGTGKRAELLAEQTFDSFAARFRQYRQYATLEDMTAALRLTASPDPQVWYISTAGRAVADIAAGRLAGDPTLAFIEWPVDPDT